MEYWWSGGTETEIIVPVSVLGPERAGTEMGGDRSENSSNARRLKKER